MLIGTSTSLSTRLRDHDSGERFGTHRCVLRVRHLRHRTTKYTQCEQAHRQRRPMAAQRPGP
jgi:hypothetical protein